MLIAPHAHPLHLRIELKKGTYRFYGDQTTRSQYEIHVGYDKLIAHKPEVCSFPSMSPFTRYFRYC